MVVTLGAILARGRGWAPARATRAGNVADPPAYALTAAAPEGPASPGEIESRWVELPVPAANIDPNECARPQDAWVFRGRDLRGVMALARSAGLSDEQVARLPSLTRCDAEGCRVEPDRPLLDSLTPAGRTVLYGDLARYRINELHAYSPTRPLALGPWAELPGLPPRVRAVLTWGTWRRPAHYAFSDITRMCEVLPTQEERDAAIGALFTRHGFDAWVRVPPAGDLEPLVRYWSRGGDEAATRRALLAARAGDGRAPVSALLPEMARRRLNRFPRATDPEYDCYWTALNFFAGPTPPDDMPGKDGIAAALNATHVEVPLGEVRLGDVIAFVAADGAIAHTVNHVAGDFVFSKNGLSHTRPWLITRLDELRVLYFDRTLRAFRRR